MWSKRSCCPGLRPVKGPLSWSKMDRGSGIGWEWLVVVTCLSRLGSVLPTRRVISIADLWRHHLRQVWSLRRKVTEETLGFVLSIHRKRYEKVATVLSGLIFMVSFLFLLCILIDWFLAFFFLSFMQIFAASRLDVPESWQMPQVVNCVIAWLDFIWTLNSLSEGDLILMSHYSYRHNLVSKLVKLMWCCKVWLTLRKRGCVVNCIIVGFRPWLVWSLGLIMIACSFFWKCTLSTRLSVQWMYL